MLRRAIPAFALTALAALAASAPAHAAPGQFTILDPHVELAPHVPEADREAALDELRYLGVDVVRLIVYWRDIAPHVASPRKPSWFHARNHHTYGENGSRWAFVDWFVRAAAARGMGVLLVPSGKFPNGQVPRWASQRPNRGQNDPRPRDFNDFMFALGSRYRGGTRPLEPGGIPGAPLPRAGLVAIWNEPNSKVFLAPQRKKRRVYSPHLYRRLFVAGRRGILQSGWRGRLLVGETGPRAVLRFMQRVFCLNVRWKRARRCPRIRAGGFSHHPYSLHTPPWIVPFERTLVSVGAMRRMARGLNLAARAGAINRRMPIFITEYGYVSKPSRFGVPLNRQAAYNATAERLLFRNKRVRSFAQYLLRDQPISNFGFQSGLRFSGSAGPCNQATARCKPAYFAFRTPLSVRALRGKCQRRMNRRCVRRGRPRQVSIWGLVRPAKRRVHVQVWVRDRGKRPRRLRGVRTNRRGAFQFRSGFRRGRLWQLRFGAHRGPFVPAHRF